MNKISKGKAVGLLSLGLASVALGSVGFAAWVVSGTTVDGTSDIHVSVGEVNDKRVTIEAKLGSDKTVNFDADAVDGEGTMGIKASSGSTQDMTFSVDVTAVKGEAATEVTSINCKFSVTMPGGIDENYVKLIEVKQGDTNITETYKTGFSITPTTSKTTVTYTFKFGWGSYFNYQNPVAMDGADPTDVLGYLNTLRTSMNGKTISVVLSQA